MIREHVWGGVEERYCLVCGGYKMSDGSVDPRLLCLSRLDGQRAAPSPARRQYACEDSSAISSSLRSLRSNRDEMLNRSE